MNATELVLHPVRIRIVFAAMDGLPFTTSEMSRRLPDVSKASVYRHLALLADGELLEVASQELVNGIVERHYRLLRVRAVIDPAAAAAMTKDDHRRGFAAVIASLLAEFNAYLDRPESNPTSDSVSYRQFPLWLTAAERTSLVEEVSAAIQARSAHEQSAERTRHLLSTIFFPAESQVRESDLSVLRELVDEGNEEAERRLTELSVQRGDLDELRRLVDGGSEEAERRLTELAVQRGDLDELRRLVDGGNEEAERRLTELAVQRGDLAELRRLADEGNEEAERRLTELIRDMR
jgi:DNA-binding transcriptional ArsR family regulator